MANALTTIRLLLVIPFAFFMARGDLRHAVFALLAMALAIATDLLDGVIARQTRTISALGRTFDHSSDFLFVTCGLFAGATRGAFPWILPILITVAFAQYVVDSYWVHGQSGLRRSQLGRYNGILYFVPLCMDILIRMGLRFLHPWLTLLVWMLVLSTLASMGQRLLLRKVAEELPSRPPQHQQTDGGIEQNKEIVHDEPESGHLPRLIRKQQDPEKDRHGVHWSGHGCSKEDHRQISQHFTEAYRAAKES